ncbi:hypothetical protein E4U43_003021 [Claviceps pusilla]|uniref:Uncharacterized protein n=1 Tax=Claviceps pusilla TaxID=123648 RepID=A0A9P7SUV0_9HYPO|nr:hypothetical protein E4U43_003021 [Claviceps pusilla]
MKRRLHGKTGPKPRQDLSVSNTRHLLSFPVRHRNPAADIYPATAQGSMRIPRRRVRLAVAPTDDATATFGVAPPVLQAKSMQDMTP